MNPNPEYKTDWLAAKIGRPAAAAPDYENYERATRVLAQWMVGYDESEIASFFRITEIDVAADLQYLHEKMAPRQVIAMNNDRDRIRIHRKQSKDYSRLLDESLKTSAAEYLAVGMSPVPAMKEYRQAVGMEEKPGGVAISVTKQTATFINNPGQVHPANLGGSGRVRSFEDLVRMIIASDPSCGLQPVIETDAHEALPSPNLDDDESAELPEEVDEPADESTDED